MKKQQHRFLVNVVGDFKRNKIFVCVVCPFYLLTSFVQLILHEKKEGKKHSQVELHLPFSSVPPRLSLSVSQHRREWNPEFSGYCLTWHWFHWSAKSVLQAESVWYACVEVGGKLSFSDWLLKCAVGSIKTIILPNHCILPKRCVLTVDVW